MKDRIAVFPGSFDPFTLGHEEIIRKGLSVFDKIVVGIGTNAEKKYMYSASIREQWIRDTFSDTDRIVVQSYQGLTVDFCKKVNAGFILRGLRTSSDFEFEKAIAHMNGSIQPGIETFFVLTRPEYASLSSTIVRDIIRNGGDAKRFVPAAVRKSL